MRIAALLCAAAALLLSPVVGRAEQGYTLRIVTEGPGRGRVTVVPQLPRYPAGTVVTLTAVASGKNVFRGWQRGAAPRNQMSVEIVMDRDREAVARFEVLGIDPVPERIAPADMVVGLVEYARIPSSLPPESTASRAGYAPVARINHMKPLRDGSGRRFVGDQRGVLHVLSRTGQVSPYLDLRAQTARFSDWPGLTAGLNAFAIAPDFRTTGRFYTVHVEVAGERRGLHRPTVAMPIASNFVLTEWTAKDPTADAFEGPRREIARFEGPDAQHGVQDIGFDPNLRPTDPGYGALYLLVGDGTSVWRGNARGVGRPDSLFGAVLRIDPTGRDGRGGTYGIPAGNPYKDGRAVAGFPEVWAYGFRNPHKLSWDTGGQGHLFVSDVGESNLEELNLVLPGRHYGWPRREGTWTVDPDGDLSTPRPPEAAPRSFDLTDPVLQIDHDEASAISGGFVYRGAQIPALQGRYVFGDIGSGRVFVADADAFALGRQAVVRELLLATPKGVTNLSAVVGSPRVDLHLGTDEDGEIYLLSKVDGVIRRLVPVPSSPGAVK
jgi:glucose/arabinose dehydrogenase